MSEEKTTPLDVTNTKNAVDVICKKAEWILGSDWDRFQYAIYSRALNHVHWRQEGISKFPATLENAVFTCLHIVGKMRQPVIDRLVEFTGCEVWSDEDAEELPAPPKKPETKILDPFDFVFDPLGLLESVQS
jgi:hypothetical protein